MTGTTHFRIGILYYFLFTTVPCIAAIPIFGDPRLTALGIVAAGLGALMPDLDSQHSKINHMNPVLGTVNKAVDRMELVLVNTIRLAFTLGIGILIIFYADMIKSQLPRVNAVEAYASWIVYGSAALLILLGAAAPNTVSKVPGIAGLVQKIGSFSSFIKRGAMCILYGGLGAGIIIYNYSTFSDPYIYLVGFLLLASTVFPHRSFFHSPEGLVLFTVAASYVFDRLLDDASLTFAFFAGYFSHLYLADILTKEGVPISSLPAVFKKVRLHRKLCKHRWYKRVYKFLSMRLTVPLMSTGSSKGNLFESGYTLVLLTVLCMQLLR